MDSTIRNVHLEQPQQDHHKDTTPLPRNLVGIFKVRFHVHRGNELVWQYPPDLDLQGVEYQMICSGLHLVDKDTIYFSRWNGFGVGVFEKQAIDHDRGASMQAIGVLVNSSLNSWQHIPFLSQHIGKNDESTSLLEDYFNTNRLISTLPLSPSSSSSSSSVAAAAAAAVAVAQETIPINPRYLCPFESVPSALSYYVDSSHTDSQHAPTTTSNNNNNTPFDSFNDMITTLGPTIFVLWKAILIKQRVLLMKPAPPMEKLCHFVYNGYLMDQWRGNKARRMILPKFNIGINDITDLEKESEGGYIACTCDTIFDIKKDLYDVLVKLPPPSLINDTDTTTTTTLVTSSHKINAADLARYQLLIQLFPPEQQLQLPLQQSSNLTWYPYYRYEGIRWWDGLKIKETLEIGWNQCFASCRDHRRRHSSSSSGDHHPPRLYERDGWKKYQQQLGGGSIHALDETEALLESSEQTDGDGGQDAEEIDSRTILNVSQNDLSPLLSSHDSLNHSLLGFFHVLSSQLISTLQTILLSNTDDDDDEEEVEVTITIQDMLRLGLEPWEDRGFVNQLGQVYFGKQIKVTGCTLTGCTLTCCSGQDPIQL